MTGSPSKSDEPSFLSLERLERYQAQGQAIEFELVLSNERWFIFARIANTQQYADWTCVFGERSQMPNTMDANRLFNQLFKVKDKFPTCPIAIDAGDIRLVSVEPDPYAIKLLSLVRSATPIQIGAITRTLDLERGVLRVPVSIVNAIRYFKMLIVREKIAAVLAILGKTNKKTDDLP